MEKTYRMRLENYMWLQGRLEKLAKRAKKIGCEPITITEISRESVWLASGTLDAPDKVIHVYVTVKVTGESPRIEGWKHVATLTHGELGNIIRSFAEVDTKWRTAEPFCDHCKTRRRRNETFVLEKNGEYMQVGRNCVIDFIGHANAQQIAEYASLVDRIYNDIDNMSDDDEWIERNIGMKHFDDLEYYLSWVCACIRARGWKSATQAREDYSQSTADWAWSCMKNSPRQARWLDSYGFEELSIIDADKELAKTAIDWAVSVSEREDLSDYLYNISLIAKRGYLEWKEMGFSASIVRAYQKEQEKINSEKARRERGESQYFGTVGKREEFELTLLGSPSFENFYGFTFFHRFTDVNGNIAVWKTGSRHNMNEGETYIIKGTVKEHGEYRGEKQTVLTRCAVSASETK